MSKNPAIRVDPRSRHGSQAVTVTTGGIPLESGNRAYGDVLEGTYDTTFQLTIDCTMGVGSQQFWTLPPGVYGWEVMVIEGGGGAGAAADIRIDDIDQSARVIAAAIPLDATMPEPIPMTEAIELGDTEHKRSLIVEMTSVGTGVARVALLMHTAIGGWK